MMKKIFYGVQGTGNGHITRARVMAKALANADFEVVFQFTGRPAEKYFDMECFGAYQIRDGLTFNTSNGQVSYVKTALQSKPVQLIRDIKSLDLSDFDLVITDFEPVTAWAAKRQNKKVVGIGHQYAFEYSIPREGDDWIANQVMKTFAPAQVGVGLHWHHFNQPILPPIIETPDFHVESNPRKILVYLPFEETKTVQAFLAPYTDFEFHVYTPNPLPQTEDHILIKPLSRDGFQADLHDCVGVISNAGFELASESLQLGKKILVKPLHAQMEQISNAAALRQLGYGQTMFNLDAKVLQEWLEQTMAIQVVYPDVSRILVNWMEAGMPAMDASFIETVWNQVNIAEVRL